MTTDRMRERIAEMVAADANLRTLSYLLGAPGMVAWANCIGVASDAVLAGCVAPIPPVELRSIVSDENIAPFLYAGFLDAEAAASIYEQYGRALDHRPTVLDFGCGCGRVMRFFDPNTWTIYGAEINQDHVDWCNANLPGTRSSRNSNQPPLPFDDQTIDFAYSFSVFSHLPRELASTWLADLGRILRPDGVAMITAHGYTALKIIAGSPNHQLMFRLTSEQAVAIGDALAAAEIVYLPYDADVLEAAHAGPVYGNAFMDPDYAKRAWNNDQFELAVHIPGGNRGWQDVYVLRRR